MNKTEFLPLGSIVIIKGNVKKVMVIARGLAAVVGEEAKYFDYGACLYPEGLIGDSLLYFNHENISKIIQKGYSDVDNEMMVENIIEWVESTPIEKGDPYALNQQNNRVKIPNKEA